MNTITVDHPAAGLFRSTRQLAIVLLVAVALLVGAFAAGRAASTTRTVRTIVRVPAASVSAPSIDDCHLGQAC